MKRNPKMLLLLSPVLIFSLVSCFGGVKRTGKVVGYKDGQVLTKKGHYQVGTLPKEWNRISLGKAMVTFRNDPLKSTIATDSFCDQAYNDSSLKSLTQHLFAGLQDIKVLEEVPFMLDERGAQRTLIEAKLDGVPVKVDIVVVKKDWCLFDFYLVSDPSRYAEASGDFQTFYQGFKYTGGI